MHVAGFMIPAAKVATCSPTDKIRKALETMLDRKVSCIVVVVKGTYTVPIGLVTKTDVLGAYQQGLTVEHQVLEIMTKDFQTCYMTDSRDQAASILERNKCHHALVIDQVSNHFMGIISSWDITAECAKDHRAWPWNRPPDGRFHPQEEKTKKEEAFMIAPSSPTSTAEGGEDPLAAAAVMMRPGIHRSQMGDSFRAYIDNLGYFD
jgi:CBS domain-containing protein